MEHRITLPERLRKVWSRGGEHVWSVPVDPPPPWDVGDDGLDIQAAVGNLVCPYQPGDVLLVGEALIFTVERRFQYEYDELVYASDLADVPWEWPEGWEPDGEHSHGATPWVCVTRIPAENIPDEACRLRARVLSVGAPTPLSDMTEVDVRDEGFGNPILRNCKLPMYMEAWAEAHPAHPWDRAWRWPVEVDVPADGRKE